MPIIEEIFDEVVEDQELVDKAQLLKEEGNKFYTNNQLIEAIQSYSEAIKSLLLLKPTESEIEESENQNEKKDKKQDEINSNTEDKEELKNEKEEKESDEESENEQKEAIERKNALDPQFQKKKKISICDQVKDCHKKYVSVYFCNRAACFLMQEQFDSAVEDCTKSIELDPKYMKAYLRRAKAYESLDKLQEALKDYEKVLELDKTVKVAQEAVVKLPPKIKEKQEREKEEMLKKLKELGNSFLGLFGLSTENFKFQQDPNTGGYSINFQK